MRGYLPFFKVNRGRRITSYNVCYTKLLRLELADDLGFPLLVRPSYVLGGQKMKIVITSYSIHYTKLYDHLTNINVPQEILDIEKKIEDLKDQKNEVIKSQQYEKAAELRDSERNNFV